MALYNIYAGLSGGFGGANYIDTVEAEDIDEAYKYAYEAACEEYESYEGMYGVISKQDIIDNAEEYGIDPEEDEEEIEAIYIEEREDWIEYYVILADEDENEVEVEYY